MTAFTDLVSSQIALIVGHSSQGDLDNSMQILGMLMQSLGDRVQEYIYNMMIMQEMKRKGGRK